MTAYERHETRRAALNILAANPFARVHLPEQQDPMEALRSLSTAMLMECTDLSRADEMARDYELLINPGELIKRASEAFAATRTHSFDEFGRRDAQAALGADVIRIIYAEIEKVAARQLEKEM